MAGSHTRLIATACLAAALSGCVKRALIIDSDPPGAAVRINGHPIKGVTPITYEFITHGPYTIVLSKPGFQELRERVRVQAPWHQWMPLDLVTELLLPITFDDQHRYRFPLQPLSPRQRLAEEPIPSVRDLLVQLRGAADPARRREACVLILRHRVPEATLALQEATQDPNLDVRTAALQALRVVAGREAASTLIAALLHDPEPSARWQAAAELEALRAPEGLSALQLALQDRDPLVRAAAVEALRGLGDAAAIPMVALRLKDREPVVRRSAADALGRLGGLTASVALARALRDPDPEVRRRAANSLLLLKASSESVALARALRDLDPRVRETAIRALREFGTPPAVPVAVRWLRSWSAATRAAAAQALGGLREPLAAEPLGRAIRRERNIYTALAMAIALTELKAWPDIALEPYRGRVTADELAHRPKRESAPASKKTLQNPSSDPASLEGDDPGES